MKGIKNGTRLGLLWLLALAGAWGQSFAAASLKPSPQTAGVDSRGTIITAAGRISANNVTLKMLIAAAYQVQAFQVQGGPGWLDNDGFDLDARSSGAAASEQLDAMLQALLAERFGLKIHRESRNLAVYALEAESQNPDTRSAGRGGQGPGARGFQGTTRQLADLISLQLSIPDAADPTRPAMASGPPQAVIDRSGWTNAFAFFYNLNPAAGGDLLSAWQRVLHDELGLKLVRQYATVQIVGIDAVQRNPAGN